MKKIIYITIAVLLIALAIVIFTPKIAAHAEVAKNEEVKTVATTSPLIIKNLDSEISRLASLYKVDESLAREIIRCESRIYKKATNENLDKNGNIWSKDHGYWQINDYWHEETAKKLGFNIYDEWDNLEYGFILISQQGTSPWSASKGCWDK